MKDMHSVIVADQLLAAATYAADNTPVSVDLQGYDSAEIVLQIGAGGITFSGTNKIEFVLTHSDDDSSYSAVTLADMLGVTSVTSGIIKSLIAAHGTASTYRFGYVGGKRYLRLLADFSGTHGTGTPLGAAVIKGTPMIAPTANAA